MFVILPLNISCISAADQQPLLEMQIVLYYPIVIVSQSPVEISDQPSPWHLGDWQGSLDVRLFHGLGNVGLFGAESVSVLLNRPSSRGADTC